MPRPLATSDLRSPAATHGREWRCGPWLGLLALVYLATVFAGFLSPDDPAAQHRDLPFAPPTRLHLMDAAGRLHLRPFVYVLARSDGDDVYAEDRSRISPVRFFVRGAPYRVAGAFSGDRHLIGTDGPGHLFLMGSDDFGRDQFSRFLHGGQISLFAGLLGAGLSLGVGIVLGGAGRVLRRVGRCDDHARGGAVPRAAVDVSPLRGPHGAAAADRARRTRSCWSSRSSGSSDGRARRA